ncbi:hypothetical protein HYPSUDRAFT_784063 [Hypholoma sublateritium FD-334 SS-4]|uniref:Uncharacterized protein n=1 Tax=Hypholoma sublateritium (strain FD-334 SS-4) TaxID=945553 RepID=A0A0D2L220_HYPSF|nr:hypothetical protein HYPSUDRAFT_784063 [Hypholoma sublateritium FD-334 SS-4]
MNILVERRYVYSAAHFRRESRPLLHNKDASCMDSSPFLSYEHDDASQPYFVGIPLFVSMRSVCAAHVAFCVCSWSTAIDLHLYPLSCDRRGAFRRLPHCFIVSIVQRLFCFFSWRLYRRGRTAVRAASACINTFASTWLPSRPPLFLTLRLQLSRRIKCAVS